MATAAPCERRSACARAELARLLYCRLCSCRLAAAAEQVGVEQDTGAAVIGGPLDHAQVPVGVEPDIVVQFERIQVIDAGEVDADVSLDDAKGGQVRGIGADRCADVVAACGVPAPSSA